MSTADRSDLLTAPGAPDRSPAEVLDGGTALDWFGALWAAAALFHLAANGQHLVALDGVGLLQLAMVGLATTMLARPGWPVAGGLAAVSLVVLWLKLPVVGNHEIILGLVNLAVLGAVVRRGAGWVIDAAPAARIILLVSYGFIALSKLNEAFFDPAVSCAVVFGDEVGRWIGLSVAGRPALEHGVIYATAAIEIAIPILLVLRPVRHYGVMLGLGFHFVLALEPEGHVWDFTSVLLPLFLLFGPAEVDRRLDRLWRRLVSRSTDERVLVVALVVAAHGLVVVGGQPIWLVAYPVWLMVGGSVLGAAMAGLLAHRAARNDAGAATPETAGPTSSRGTGLAFRVGPAMLLVVGLAVLNGVAPYLEWRSAAAFNMYSNLQVADGRSNHLLVRTAIGGGPGRPTVPVLDAPDDSPLRWYAARGLAVPAENLWRYHAEHPTVEATVEVAGQAQPIERAAAAEGRPTAKGILATLSHKLGFRRAVDPSGPVQCLRAWGPAG